MFLPLAFLRPWLNLDSRILVVFVCLLAVRLLRWRSGCLSRAGAHSLDRQWTCGVRGVLRMGYCDLSFAKCAVFV